MRNLPIVARRDLAAYFHSPAGLAVAGLFLTLQGLVIWMFIQFLGRPDAPPGAVMEFFFGGTILYWIAMGLLATVVPMRLLSEELRTGTLETLLTAPVTGADVVVGKWLAALGFFASLWAPTLLYLVYLKVVGAGLDPGPIAAGYLGTLLLGAAALALGLFASSLTRNQLVAATLSFVGFFVVLLVGVLETRTASAFWAGLLRRASLFRVMEDFGHGIVDSRHVILLGSATVVSLVATQAALAIRTGRGPRSRRPGQGRGIFRALLIPGLVLVIAGMINYLGGRHFLRGDWTRDRVYALSEKTVTILQALGRPVTVTVFLHPNRDTEEARALGSLIRELCDRFHRYAPDNFQVQFVDPDRAPERAEALQKKYAISAYDLSEGVVIFTAGTRAKYITKDDLVDYQLNDEGEPGPRVRAWKGEPAFVTALLTVIDDHPPVICFVQGHSEPDIESLQDGGYATFAEEIRRDGYQVQAVRNLAGEGVAAPCTLLAIVEPQLAYSDSELAAVDRFVTHGGRLLLMLGPVFSSDASTFAHVRLEAFAARWGARLADNLVVDPPHASDVEGPSVWTVNADGYVAHPITARLGGRVTVWPRTREVSPSPDTVPAGRTVQASPLVHSSPQGWGETDLPTIRGQADLTFDAGRDRKGPVNVAVAVSAQMPPTRLVFIGTGRLAMNYRLTGAVVRDFNRDFMLSAIAWLTDREVRAGIGPKTPEQMQLTLTAATVAWAFRLFVIGVPLACLLGAALVAYRRRV